MLKKKLNTFFFSRLGFNFCFGPLSGKIDLTFNFENKVSGLSGVSGLSEWQRFLKEKKNECQKFPIEWIECHSMSGGSPDQYASSYHWYDIFNMYRKSATRM